MYHFTLHTFHSSLFIILSTATIALLTSCHTTKRVANQANFDTNTHVASLLRSNRATLDSALHAASLELDSFDLTVEPIILTPCPEQDTIRSPIMAYRYHLKANRVLVKENSTAVCRSVADTLLTANQNTLSSYKADTSEESENTALYKPPSAWAVVGIIAIILSLFLILWRIKTRF